MPHPIKTLFFLLISGIATAQNPQLMTVPYISGLVKPVEITHCKDSRLFIIEQDGRIRIVKNDTLLSIPFLDIDTQVKSTGNEQGLLGLAFHPDYKNNGYFYVNYINNNGNTTVSRFAVDPLDSNRAVVNSELVLLTVNQPYANHNGGDLLFGQDGYLYIPLGDGGSANDPQNRSQNTLERLGKTLRIDVNHGNLFAIPPDNPFLNDSNYLPDIWNLGLRNPWRTCFDQTTGDFWIGDVGQNVWEEIDFQESTSAGGENYGWRCYEASVPFDTTGCQAAATFSMPVYEFSHSTGNCSVTGGEVYRGSKYSNLFGHYLFSDFCMPILRTIKKTGNQFIFANNTNWSGAGISCFGQDWRGELYAANLYNGQVRKIIDTSSCIPVAWLADADTISICGSSTKLISPYGDSLNYSWMFNGSQLPSITSNELTINQSGTYIISVTGTQGVCRNADTVYVNLKGSLTPVTMTGLSSNYCLTQSPATLTGNPTGGTFSGLGVIGNSFSPGLAGAGTILIQYSFTDNNGCTSKIIQETDVRNCAGILLNDARSRFNVYPNPAHDNLMIKFSEGVFDMKVLTIFDIYGKLIYSERISLSVNNKDVLVPTLNYPQGTYIIQLTDQAGVSSSKLFNVIH